MNELLTIPEFIRLEAHIEKLLGRSQIGFGSNKDEYLLFLAYLIIYDEYEFIIGTVDIGIQLLLSMPHKFWFNNSDYTREDEKQNLKRNIIKYILLRNLELFVLNNSIFVKKMLEMNSFIAVQKNRLEQALEGQNFTEVFKQNMDFISPRNINFRNNDFKRILSYSFGRIGAVTSLFATARWGLEIVGLTGDNADYDHNEFRARKTLLGTLFFVNIVFFGFVSDKMGNFALRYFTSNNQRWDNISVNDFVTVCHTISELAALSSSSIRVVNSIWTQASALSDLGGKAPIFLRSFMMRELETLKEAMPLTDFIKLLVCLLTVDEVPPINDNSNSLALDILRKPEKSWQMKYKDCNNILKNYLKLAIVEFLNQELTALASSPDFNQNKLVEMLGNESKQLVGKIQSTQATELSEGMPSDLVYSLKKALVGTVTSITLFISIVFWRSMKTQETWLEQGIENIDDWQRLIEAAKTYFISVPIGIVGGFGSFWMAGKIGNKYDQYKERQEQRDAIPSTKFFNDSINDSKQLQEIFAFGSSTSLEEVSIINKKTN